MMQLGSNKTMKINMKNIPKKILLPFLKILMPLYGIASDSEKKAQVIVMTDGEIDDNSSMIRFLLYTFDVDLLQSLKQTLYSSETDIVRRTGLKKNLILTSRFIQNWLSSIRTILLPRR
jgi:hypothetical protein